MVGRWDHARRPIERCHCDLALHARRTESLFTFVISIDYATRASAHSVTGLTLLRTTITILHLQCKKELSCRKQIARQLRTKYVEGIHRHKYYT